jgi:hypothetical protein
MTLANGVRGIAQEVDGQSMYAMIWVSTRGDGRGREKTAIEAQCLLAYPENALLLVRRRARLLCVCGRVRCPMPVEVRAGWLSG